jgi:ABC-type antimicrobial peptide transport system permease subunit
LGIAVGIVIVLAAAGLIAAQLHEVSPRDPMIIAVAAAVLLVSAAVAALVPARRAIRTDPMVALRSE